MNEAVVNEAVVMGVLNVTPDSFSDGGRWVDPERAIAHGMEMAEQGAGIIDVGGESTRPGAEPVGSAEEIRRVVEVVAELSRHVRVSVDTRHVPVAEAAIEAGASLVNDVSATLWPVVAAAPGVGWVAMHMQGEPATMQLAPVYADVVGEVAAFLRARAYEAAAGGVSEVWIDPGIGFGKTPEHNLALLRHLDVLVAGEFPVLVGTSRKSFLGALAPAPDGSPAPVHDREEASVSTAAWAMSQGAGMVRCHDVAPAVRAARLLAGVPAQADAAGGAGR